MIDASKVRWAKGIGARLVAGGVTAFTAAMAFAAAVGTLIVITTPSRRR